MQQEFGAYLRSRRERVGPQEVGLSVAGARRTPGLRREELAQLAAVSVDYVVRLEQGRLRPSESVLAALARALRLSPAEREALFTLGRPPLGWEEAREPRVGGAGGAMADTRAAAGKARGDGAGGSARREGAGG
ncbi:helix-turn-helix transcriptional regulator, partial [Solirubrobacter ginsenosidimutans]